MALFRNISTLRRISSAFRVSSAKCHNTFYDPPYLDSLKPEIPIYNALNVQIKGYDFVLLESFQSLAHKIANVMDINVEEGWGTPSTKAKIQRFKPNGTVVDSEYTLTTYERNLLITEVPSTSFSVFLQLLQASIPQGVTVNVVTYSPEQSEVRYVPDFELNELKSRLEEMGTKKK